MIFHEHKCIFIHIPKTAGTSIEKKLRLYKNEQSKGYDNYSKLRDHRIIKEFEPFSLSDLSFLTPQQNLILLYKKIYYSYKYGSEMPYASRKQYNEYFKFTFVRNPWARTYSWYKNVIRDEIHRKRFNIKKDCSFSEFLNNYSHKMPVLRSQMYWLKDKKENIPMDFIGRFENLENDFAYVCDQIGIEDNTLPKMLVANNAKYTGFYDNKTKDLIAKVYKEEIEYFGFEFGE